MVIMSVDLGKARTGIAVCDKNELLASPLGTIEERNFEGTAEKVFEIAKTRGVELFVVGLPKNMDGTEGESAENARSFAEYLSKISVDSVAAVIILENYLSRRKSTELGI